MARPVADREDKIAEARELRAQGWTLQRIADHVGVSETAVWRWLNPEAQRAINLAANARKRAWENAHRAPCSRCGSPMGMGSQRADGSRRIGDLCATCLTDRRVDLVLEMMRLRNEKGLLNMQIAERLDMPRNTVSSELYRMRALGFPVARSPYRGIASRDGRAQYMDRSTRVLARALAARGITPER